MSQIPLHSSLTQMSICFCCFLHPPCRQYFRARPDVVQLLHPKIRGQAKASQVKPAQAVQRVENPSAASDSSLSCSVLIPPPPRSRFVFRLYDGTSFVPLRALLRCILCICPSSLSLSWSLVKTLAEWGAIDRPQVFTSTR